MTGASQLPLFGHEQPSFDVAFSDLERTELGQGAWFDYVPGWVKGPATLFDLLQKGVRWRSERREMYERTVDVPRLVASFPDDGPEPDLPILDGIRRALTERYGEAFARVSSAYYRDGRDSVAFHGDTIARKLSTALVATLSLGGPRRFLVRPTGGGRSLSLSLGSGDLLVMGGTAQRTFQHSVPKAKSAPPRIAVMFRPVWNDV